MTVTPEQFARKMATLGPRMERNLKGSVNKAAFVLKTSVQANLLPDTGGDFRMSGVGSKATRARGGAPVGVRYTVKNDDKGDPTALLRMTGPAHLLERDTAPHTILPKGVGRVQGRRTRANRLAARQNLYDVLFQAEGSAIRGRQHPGTKGKHTFEKGIERATPAARKILGRAVGKSLGGVFR